MIISKQCLKFQMIYLASCKPCQRPRKDFPPGGSQIFLTVSRGAQRCQCGSWDGPAGNVKCMSLFLSAFGGCAVNKLHW